MYIEKKDAHIYSVAIDIMHILRSQKLSYRDNSNSKVFAFQTRVRFSKIMLTAGYGSEICTLTAGSE